MLKRNALAAPFERAFKQQHELESSGETTASGEFMQIHYRDEEAIYVQASHDRVTVFFSTVFREETDRVLGKVFLQVKSHIFSNHLSLTMYLVGICGCSSPLYATKRTATPILQQRSPIGVETSTRIANERRPGIRHLW